LDGQTLGPRELHKGIRELFGDLPGKTYKKPAAVTRVLEKYIQFLLPTYHASAVEEKPNSSKTFMEAHTIEGATVFGKQEGVGAAVLACPQFFLAAGKSGGMRLQELCISSL